MPTINLDEAIDLAVADARQIVASRTTPGGLAIDIGHVVETFLSGLFVQIVTRLLMGGTSYIFRKVSTQREVDVLKVQTVVLISRQKLETPSAACDASSKLEREVNALLQERGFTKEVSERVTTSIIAKAQDFVKKAREE
jgi:hypothetical protein